MFTITITSITAITTAAIFMIVIFMIIILMIIMRRAPPIGTITAAALPAWMFRA
jgi:hypothetical protein